MTENGNANVEIVRKFCEAWSKADVPAIISFFADDAVYHNMPINPVQGKDAIKGMIEQFMTPFERAEFEITYIAAAGDVVLTERIDRFIGEKSVALPVMGTFEIRDGKIAAWRDYFDLGAWTKQMA
ncbi:MAG: limonene-1,2-epoxide hydrolase family protein [Dehalococcoidia bacterium]